MKMAKYICPMCPGVESAAPGDCPMCGMALERNPASETKIYTCPMHPEIRQDHPGDCPICGMALELLNARPEEAEDDQPELKSMTLRLIVGVPLVLPLLVLAMGAHSSFLSFIPPGVSAWIQWVLSTPVVLWCGW